MTSSFLFFIQRQNIDAANFAEAVMDDKIKAKQIVDIGISKLKTQLTELEDLQKELAHNV